MGSYNALEGKEDFEMENRKDFRASFPGNCNGYKRKGDAPDSVGDICGTCSLEESCVHLEMVQLVNAIEGCLPLSGKLTPAGEIARDFLTRSRRLLLDLSKWVTDCKKETSKKAN